MSAIPTVTLRKGNEKQVVNVGDEGPFIERGYTPDTTSPGALQMVAVDGSTQTLDPLPGDAPEAPVEKPKAKPTRK